METRRKIFDILIIPIMGKFWTAKYGEADIFTASEVSYRLLYAFKIPGFFHVFAIIASAMVPIRDINRRWIGVAKLISHFGPANKVNGIVVYDFFCLSVSCREREQEN